MMLVRKSFAFLLLLFAPYFYSCVQHDLSGGVDCSLSGLSVSVIEIDSATDCTTTDGAIRVVVEGGVPPYSFWLNDQEFPTSDFENLHAGIYSVLVRDQNGCEDTINNVLVMAKDILFTTHIEPDTECFSDNGSITIEITEGGNPPYLFQLGTGTFSEINTFTQLPYGNYLINVKDNTDCQLALNVTVPRGQTAVTWTGDIQPLMALKCADEGCHNGEDRINDFRKYPDAKFYAKQIKAKTHDKSMPQEGSLAQSEIDMIACWVDDGALEN